MPSEFQAEAANAGISGAPGGEDRYPVLSGRRDYHPKQG